MASIDLIPGFESFNENDKTIDNLNSMALTDLERIGDYADMIKDRMSQGQTLDAWMYSKISDSVKNLNSVHDTMDGKDGITDEEKEWNKEIAIMLEEDAFFDGDECRYIDPRQTIMIEIDWEN